MGRDRNQSGNAKSKNKSELLIKNWQSSNSSVKNFIDTCLLESASDRSYYCPTRVKKGLQVRHNAPNTMRLRSLSIQPSGPRTSELPSSSTSGTASATIDAAEASRAIMNDYQRSDFQFRQQPSTMRTTLTTSSPAKLLVRANVNGIRIMGKYKWYQF